MPNTSPDILLVYNDTGDHQKQWNIRDQGLPHPTHIPDKGGTLICRMKLGESIL